jgi:hypothetical protein
MRTIVQTMAFVADCSFFLLVLLLLRPELFQPMPEPQLPVPVVDWSQAYEFWNENTGDLPQWQPRPQYQPRPRYQPPMPQMRPSFRSLPEKRC